MVKKVRLNNFDNLVPGREYFVVCGIWQSYVSFVSSFQYGRITRYRFTFGPADNWQN